MAELRELAAGRTDLLAEVAGILIGFHEREMDEPRVKTAARLLIVAGADESLIPQWVEEGRRRAEAARLPPFAGLVVHRGARICVLPAARPLPRIGRTAARARRCSGHPGRRVEHRRGAFLVACIDLAERLGGSRGVIEGERAFHGTGGDCDHFQLQCHDARQGRLQRVSRDSRDGQQTPVPTRDSPSRCRRRTLPGPQLPSQAEAHPGLCPILGAEWERRGTVRCCQKRRPCPAERL